jgi:hypothetical protein
MLLGFEWFVYELDLIFTINRLIEGQCRVCVYMSFVLHIL